LDEAAERTMRSVYWWGIPTFFGCPHVPDAAGADVALIGLPHSTGNGSTERDQHLGPRAIRGISNNWRPAHVRFGIDPWTAATVVDAGDLVMPSFMVSDTALGEAEEHLRQVLSGGARPIVVGGDHSVPLPVLRALAGPHGRLGRSVALVHFDAHYDTFDRMPDWFGVVDSAGHWASRAVHEGLVDPAHSLLVGRRGHLSVFAQTAVSEELGYRVIDKDEFDELGIDGTVAAIRERVGDLPVYVSFDLDVLDPSVAPAVSNLVFGEEGLTMKEALRTLQGLRGLDLAGGDLVCIMPTKDSPNQITAGNGAAILFELVSLIADRLAVAGGSRRDVDSR
jgi:guanidinopropionase